MTRGDSQSIASGARATRTVTAGTVATDPPAAGAPATGALATGHLIVDPEAGLMTNAQGESIRLAPVNMKVLLALLRRPQTVVSRNEIFEFVWRNQVVSEDALTRCVSDIRAELKALCGRDDLIETLPKRGYRWTQPVHEPLAQTSAMPGHTPAALGHEADQRARLRERRPAAAGALSVGRLVGRGIAWLVALVAMASLIVTAIDRLTAPGPAVIAVLPIATAEAGSEVAARLEIELSEFLMALDAVEILSGSAVASRPANPFPFFYFEFGARWLIESELRKTVSGYELSVAIVDARTGIVQFQTRHLIDGAVGAIEPLAQPLAGFFDAELRERREPDAAQR